jgi:hypothetical protein
MEVKQYIFNSDDLESSQDQLHPSFLGRNDIPNHTFRIDGGIYEYYNGIYFKKEKTLR